MNARPAHYDELTRLISALLDGRLPDAERVLLETFLANDIDARRLYLQMIDQEIELTCLVVPADGGKVVPFELEGAAPMKPRWRWLAIAALLLLTALIAAMMPRIFERKNVAPVVVVEQDDAMSEDFESGVLAGWEGKIVTAGLPAGSKFGIASVWMPYPSGGVHLIKAAENWHDGLFALTDRSTLHVIYRLGKPGHVNVFIHTLAPDAPGAFAMFQLRTTSFPRNAHSTDWQTVAIPFSEFIRKVPASPGGPMEFTGGPPLAGERVTTLIFSSPDEPDLVIDRVWVTPGAEP